MTAPHQVLVSIYAADDPSDVNQRLAQAVAAFCETSGIQAPPAEHLITARADRGKPYFPHTPWLHLSISHSGKYWACAIADQIVGLDIQQKQRPRRETPEEMIRRHQKMARRFFHPLETEFVDRDPGYNFLTVWTAREAYVKYTGQGIDQYFSEHCVVPEAEADRQRISGRTDRVQWSAMGKHFRKSYFDGDYTLCICTDTPCEYTVTESPEN